MRITKQHKQEIKKHLARKVFQKKHDAIARKITDAIMDAAYDFFKNDHDRAIALGKENEDLLTVNQNHISAEDMTVKSPRFLLLDEHKMHLCFRDTIRTKSVSFFVSKRNSHIASVELTDQQKKKLTEHLKTLDELHDEYCLFLRGLSEVLDAAKTKSKLEELLPEAIEFLPEQPKKLPTPVTTVQAIRNKIKGAE